MSKKQLLILLSIVSLFYSCKREQISATKEAKLLSEMLENDIDFQYFSSKAKVSFDDGKANMSSPINIKIEKGNQVWTSITPILGIEAVRAKITSDSVFVVNRLQKEYSLSSFDFLNQQFGVALNYLVLENLIMGDIPIKDLKNVKLKESKDNFLLTQNINEYQATIEVDKTLNRMTKFSLTDTKNNKIEAIYSDFTLLNNQHFAQTITITILQENNSKIDAVLNHKKISSETEPLSFPFNIPSNYSEKSYAK